MNVKGVGKLVSLVCLLLSCSVAVLVRVFSVVRYQSIIHEFDPWFNFRSTQFLAQHSLAEFWNWYDSESWYPLGRDVGGTLYPGLMLTAALAHSSLRALGLPLSIREVCVFLPPASSALTVISGYLLADLAAGQVAGLTAGLFLGLAPSFMSRSVAGGFDNEAVSICAMLTTFYLFLKGCRHGSLAWSLAAALSYFYMALSWGGYTFVANLLPLYVLLLVLFGRYSQKHYIAYSVFHVFGTILAMQVRFVGFSAVSASEHLFGHFVFILLQVLRLDLKVWAGWLRKYGAQVSVCAFGLIFGLVQLFGLSQWSERTLTLLDPSYAIKYIPIVASVAEHQSTSWHDFLFYNNSLLLLVPAGLWVIFRSAANQMLFLGLYFFVSTYFGAVMSRLMLLQGPAVVLVAGVGLGMVVKAACSSQDWRKVWPSMLALMMAMLVAKQFLASGVQIAAESLSSPSVVLMRQDGQRRQVIDDFREAYYWLRVNTPEDSVVMSWWDYGYQITGLANRTTLVDNNTWNTTHIATVGLGLASDEAVAAAVSSRLGADYVLVVFGGLSGYDGDDHGKFYWMVSIGAGVYPQLKLEDYYSEGLSVGEKAAAAWSKSLLFRLCYYRFGETQLGTRPPGYDVLRKEQAAADFRLQHFEEAFTSERWIVRIYRRKRH